MSNHSDPSRPAFPPHRQEAGYTLMEIMLVLAIIAVLVGAGVYMMVGNVDAAKETRVMADINSITTQLRTYELQNMMMPSTEQGLAALVTEPSTEPRPRRWRQLFDKVPEDPWGRPYQYRNPGARNPSKFDIFSLGPDGKESGDDIGNWENVK